MGKRAWHALRSVKLTVVLLFVLAAIAALGTMGLVPQRLDLAEYERIMGGWGRVIVTLGLNDFYTSTLFRLPFLLFMANLIACATSRSVAGIRDAVGQGEGGALIPFADREAVAQRMKAAGFRLSSEEPLRAGRRRWTFWGFPMVHLAPVLVVVGAFWGTTGGFIGTQQISVGRVADAVFDWSSREEVQIPFALQVVDSRKLYYPIDMRVTVLLNGQPPTEIEIKQGRDFSIGGTAFTGRIETFDPVSGDMTYAVKADGKTFGPYGRGNEEGAPVRFRPLAFRDLELQRLEADVALFDAGGVELKRATLAVNEPLSYEGYRIFVTAWGDDENGQPYVGFQVTRDPGQSLVWIGSILLTVGLMLLLFGDGAWVREEEGKLRVRALRGRKELMAVLAGDPASGEQTP